MRHIWGKLGVDKVALGGKVILLIRFAAIESA